MSVIYLKTPQEIEIMTEGGHILSCILDEIEKAVKPGVTTGELEDMAIRMIKEHNGEPSFKDYKSRPEDPAFPTALCTSINEEVVHAPAKPSRRLKSGDIIGIDVGMGYKGYFTDMARTIAAGKISRDAAFLMKVTKKALEIGIKQVKPGNFVDDISRSIQNFVEKNGYSVVRDLVGHGVGKFVHEPPAVPNFMVENMKRVRLEEGMTLAIEPMVCQGDYHVDTFNDGWTVVTKDGKLSAHFEHSVAVLGKGCRILTK